MSSRVSRVSRGGQGGRGSQGSRGSRVAGADAATRARRVRAPHRRSGSKLGAVAASSALALVLAGCTSGANGANDDASAGAGGAASAGSQLSGDLTVYAAASLQGAMNDLLDEFETLHPQVETSGVYDGSSTLATQLVEGAPAEVFASADERTMRVAVDGGVIDGEPAIFAANELRLVVPAGNPGDVSSLDDLARADVQTVVCAPAVPCGAAAGALLAASGVDVVPASEEQNVTAVLTKIVTGEADAGLVYSSDAQAARESIEVFEPDGASDVVNRYAIAPVVGGANDTASVFIEYVLGEAGREVLVSYGFLPDAAR